MKTSTRLILILCCGLATGGINAQTDTFHYSGSIASWTVPSCVNQITITAAGAQGGDNYGLIGQNLGGKGASMTGTFTVTPGTALSIVVAQRGYNGNSSGNLYNGAGGGGGGSFVWSTSSTTLLVAAGGGGGSALIDQGIPYYYGMDAVTTTSGTGSRSGVMFSDAVGGTAGSNGTYNTGSGKGWLSVQSNPAGINACAYGGTGGYGGGGGSGCASCCTNSQHAAGGGGGYSGGGSGGTVYYYGGGGGGSYNIGTNQNNIAGVDTGNGIVIITWAASPLVVTGNVVSTISCNGGSNGSAHGTVTGGGTPYTYLWTPSAQTVATATGLSAGTYTIKVTDACGNTASASVAITQPAVLMATATTSSNVTCHAGSNGATASTVSGGTTPYTYSWTGGSTNATATGLSAGTYTLNVRDMNGCTATASTVVTQPNVLSDTSFTTANVLCHGDSSGSAFTTASGGTMPYTYLWTPGGGTTDTAVGLKAGSYTVTVSDACGASATASVSVTQPTALSITSHSAPDNGHGVGTAVVSVSGGVGPYTYLWAGGKTTDSIGGLTKGTYCVDVKDANGCTDSLCVVVKTTAGIEGITGNSGEIIVYPNPNNGQFTIESSISGASTVEIYNILGEKVFTKNLSTTKGTNTINISTQPNGAYLYRVISENGDLLGQGKITLQK